MQSTIDAAAQAVNAALPDSGTTGSGAAPQDATGSGDSSSGIAGPAATIASSAAAGVTDAVNNATRDVAGTSAGDATSTEGTPAGVMPGSPGEAVPGTPTAAGSSAGQSPPDETAPTAQPTTPDQSAPTAQPTTLPDDTAAGSPPDASGPLPVADPSRPAKRTTPADKGSTAPAAAAAASARSAAAEAPAIRVGGSVGGAQSSQSAAPPPILPASRPDTTAVRDGPGGKPRPPNPIGSLAHRTKQFAEQILPRQLPSASLGRGVDDNSALMMRIAKLLAVVYAAFLVVWFWATRVRWNGR